MVCRYRFVLIALVTLLSASSAHANLISVDAWTNGDGRLTRDTQTGLDWLDLSVTNNIGIQDVLTGNYGDLTSFGFRMATMNEAVTLITNAGGTPSSGNHTAG